MPESAVDPRLRRRQHTHDDGRDHRADMHVRRVGRSLVLGSRGDGVSLRCHRLEELVLGRQIADLLVHVRPHPGNDGSEGRPR